MLRWSEDWSVVGLGQLPDIDFCYAVKIRPLLRNLPKEPVLVSVGLGGLGRT